MRERIALKYAFLGVLPLLLGLAAPTSAVADQFTIGPGTTCPAETVTLGAATVNCNDLKNAYYDASYVASGSLNPESFSLETSVVQLPCTPGPGGCGASEANYMSVTYNFVGLGLSSGSAVFVFNIPAGLSGPNNAQHAEFEVSGGYLSGNGLNFTLDGLYTALLNGGGPAQLTVTTPITNGATSLQFTLAANATCSGTGGCGSISTIGPVGILSAQAYDANGNLVPGVPFVSESGFSPNSPPLNIATSSLPSVGASLAYQQTLSATGGTGTGYTWCVLGAESTCDPSQASLPTGFTLSTAGVLETQENSTTPPKANTYPFTVQVTDSNGNTATEALVLSILCQIGAQNLEVLPVGQSSDALPVAMTAKLVPPNGMTLAAYAQACGFSQFDWVQNITLLPAPDGNPNDEFFAEANPNSPLSAPPLLSDPPLGGYTYQFTPNGQPDPAWNAYLPNFASAYPFYYSTLDLASGCANGLLDGSQCIAPVQSDSYTLNFFDSPSSTLCEYPNSCMALQTQLVGVCNSSSQACNASGPSGPLYQWNWATNYNDPTNTAGISTSSFYLPPAGAGSGGVGITSINGVPSPSLSVDPSASNISALEPLSVGITVAQIQGQPVPAGTAMLTSGAYASTPATLDGNGNATITIPAGSLALGSDTLTVTYTPATASSATYSQAWGTAVVTVNAVTPQIAFAPTPTAQTYGTPIVAGSLDAAAQYNGNLVSGTFVYTTGACSGGGEVLTAGATVLDAGSYSITACFTPSQAGLAAASATAQYSVTPANQSISFGLIAAQLVGATIPLNASATSGMAVAFQTLTPAVCSVSQNTATMLSLGTCTIEATQSGAADYNAAAPVELSFPVMGFTLTAQPGSETVKRGVLAVFLLQVTSVNGFAGTVSISCSGGPPDSVCGDFPQTVRVEANRTALALSGILFRPEDAQGTYTITFIGISGTDTSTATAQFTVK